MALARDESGETLVELLFAVALMGLGMLVILSALFTSTAVATTNRQRTQMAQYLQSWADELTAPQRSGTGAPSYFDCQAPTVTPGGGVPLPAGMTTSITTEYLAHPRFGQPADWAALDWTDIGGCITQSGDRGLQKLTITISTDDSPVLTESMVVIRRTSKCPTGFDNADLGPC